MNTDFRISVSATQHPKVVKLMRRCGDAAFYNLVRLWTFTALNKPDGCLADMDADDIEIASGWRGSDGEFYRALVDLRLVDVDESGVPSVHDWREHNGYAAYADARSEKARKAASARWEKNAPGMNGQKLDNAPSNAPSINEHCSEHNQAMPLDAPSNAPSPAPTPAPSPTPAPYSGKDSCAEPAQAPPAAPEAPPPAEPALMVFPLAKKGEEYPVTQKDVDEWREAYPGIDVMQGLRNCLQWNRDNPTRRKTKGGIRKHISGWLAKAQNQVGRNDRASPNISTPVPMTPRQRYMRERVESIRAFREEIRHACQPDIIDVTPADPAPAQLAAAERRIEAPVPALPAGGP